MMYFVRSRMITALAMVLLLTAAAFATPTAVVRPSTVPTGAYLDGQDGDQYFVQALEVTLVTAAVGAGQTITVVMPDDMTIADTDGNANFINEISISNTATNAVTWTITAATASGFTATSAAAASAAGDKIMLLFPVLTSASPAASTADYTVTVSGEAAPAAITVTVTYSSSTLALVTFAPAFTGGDSTSLKGDGYPSSASHTNAAGALTAALPDWVVDESAGANDAFVNGTTDWDAITLDNDNNGAVGATIGTAENQYYFWASQTSGLRRIDGQDGHKPIMLAQPTRASAIAATNGANLPCDSDVETGTFSATSLIDGQALAEGNWYFYVTSAITNDWVLGQSGVVKVKHYPTFNAATANAGGGYDFDASGTFDPGAADDVTEMYLESGQKLSPAGILFGAGAVDNVDIFFDFEDVDDNATINLFYSTSATLTASDVTTSGASPNIAVTGLTGATKLNTETLYEDTSVVSYNLDIYTSASSYMTAGTYYVYMVANDGKHQTFYKVINSAAADASLKVKHLPAFTFQDHYADGAAAYALATGTQPYFLINWGQTIDGDLDVDGTMRIRLYASDLDITGNAANIGYSTTLTSVDSTKLPDLCISDPTGTVEILDRRDVSDTREANRYSWDALNSGLDAGTYYIYALCTQGGDAVIYQFESAVDDDKTIALTHDISFRALSPYVDQILKLTKEDKFEIRWEAIDKDETSTDWEVLAFALPAGGTLVGANAAAIDAGNAAGYWLTSDDGDEYVNGRTLANAGKATINVGDLTATMTGVGATPSGVYDVYLIYDSNISTTDWAGDASEVVVATGTQVEFTGTGDATWEPQFLMTPTMSGVAVGDTVTLDIYAKSDAAAVNVSFINIGVDIDNSSYLSVLDQDANTAGTQPFDDETVNFAGTVLTNSLTSTGSGYELSYTELKAGGAALATSLHVASIQLKVIAQPASGTLPEINVTFASTGDRATGLTSADGTQQDVDYADPAAVVRVASGGTVSGFVDLEAAPDDEGETVTIFVNPYASYDPITDADFLAANNDADGTDGIQVTLGAGGSFTLEQVPPGTYDFIVHKDGYLDQRITSTTVKAMATTHVNFNGANLLLAGDCAGYDNDGSSATASQPDNQIGSDDTDAIQTAFDTQSGDAAWNAYADIDGDGHVYIPDYSYAANNTGDGEGILYKSDDYQGSNDRAVARLVALGDNRYDVEVENTSAVRAYVVNVNYNTDEYELINRFDDLSSTAKTLNFVKANGNNSQFVSAIVGHDLNKASDMSLVSFELKAKVANPTTTPELISVDLVDGQHQLAKAMIEATKDALPTEYRLDRNYPNPFNPITKIGFALPEMSNVRLVVYNVMGQEVRTLVNSSMEAGVYNTVWNATDNMGRKVSSGVYFYRLFVDGRILSTQKMILLK